MESLEAADTHDSQLLTVPARFIMQGADDASLNMLAVDTPNHLCTVDWLELTKLISCHTIRNHGDYTVICAW
jgi:hypothetical protein